MIHRATNNPDGSHKCGAKYGESTIHRDKVTCPICNPLIHPANLIQNTSKAQSGPQSNYL